MRRRLPLLVIVALLLSVLPAQAQGGDTLTVLCTPQEDWCVAMTQAFQEQTGIATSYVRMSSGESLARLRATADNPEFSVWWGGPADGFIAAAEEGLVEPYESPNAAVIDPHYKDAENFTWTGVYVGALGFCSTRKSWTSWASSRQPPGKTCSTRPCKAILESRIRRPPARPSPPSGPT